MIRYDCFSHSLITHSTQVISSSTEEQKWSSGCTSHLNQSHCYLCLLFDYSADPSVLLQQQQQQQLRIMMMM